MAIRSTEALVTPQAKPGWSSKSGFGAERRVPAEWEPQECVWIAWPHNHDTWPGRFEPIPAFFAMWVKLIAESLPVRVLAGKDGASECNSFLGSQNNVELIDMPTNDCWIRDYGPTFVLTDADQSLSLVDWQYNAWGGKYPPWDLDAAVCQSIGTQLHAPIAVSELVVEGGALEFDGRGRLLTTASCLLARNRNPGLDETTVGQELHRLTGVTEVVWLDGGGLDGDDTDGHIDQLARFTDGENIVVCVSHHSQDNHAAKLNRNRLQLEAWAETTFPKPTVHPLPAPAMRRIHEQAVPQSYCNFLRLGPDRLLVPKFQAPEDDYAAGLLRELTGADVTQVDCSDLAWGLGALHCASRDQPKINAIERNTWH
ncbi:MAG: agmatine deiminase family protein [Rubripirellula sp.]|jgi:agmatine deiminase